VTEDDKSNEVVIPPQGRVSAEVEAALWELAGQVVSILQLAGIPAQVEKFGPRFTGAVVTVDTSLSDPAVQVDWAGSDALYEAGRQARERLDMQDPARLFYAQLINVVMPEPLGRVLEAAGLRVIANEESLRVEGQIPAFLKALIED
jgi:hypothetical protein